MAKNQYQSGSTTLEEQSSGGISFPAGGDLLGHQAAALAAGPQYASGGPAEGQFETVEETGDFEGTSAGAAQGGIDDEVMSPAGTEAGEEFFEASPEQMSAESGEETAESDLSSIEGFERHDPSQEGSAVVEPHLRDAGEAVAIAAGPQEEFLPFLASLIPTLVSTIGPTVAKGIASKLSPKTRKALKKRAAPLKAVAGAVVKAIPGVAGARPGAGGTGDLLALLAKLLEKGQQAPTKTGESGMEVDEAVIEQAVAALEVIIGTDDRVRITNTKIVPWRWICALRIQFPSGATYRGTGFRIGPRAVATAGHCVYLHNQGGWARQIEVIPGCNGSERPFGQAVATQFRSVVGWVTQKRPASDYGCIVLPNGAFGGQNHGRFGFAAFTPQVLLAQPVVVAGYPGDKPFAELWGMSRRIKSVTAETLIYDIDTMGGQSGAPVYMTRDGKRYDVGVHNYGAAAGNSATRVTTAVYQRLLAWSQI